MQYEFPELTDIQQVRDAVAWHSRVNGGKTEFIEAERDGFIVFNYLVSLPTTFPATNWCVVDIEVSSEIAPLVMQNPYPAILRECRGLTFYPGGQVAARKFHKFFNLGEKPETDFAQIDWSQPHVILEKLDGSMISPFAPNPDDIDWETIRWHTKMGDTEVAQHVYDFINDNPHYARWAAMVIASGRTPLFEFCSRKNRIVIDHPVDRLVLLAIRDNVTGKYAKHDELEAAARSGIEVVRQYDGTAETMEKFIEQARDEKDIEGYVIRFESGHMLKIKCDVYVTLHKSVSQLSQEKDVWRLVLEDKVDDLKALLPEDRRAQLDEFQTELMHRVDVWVKTLESEYNSAIDNLSGMDFSIYEYPDREHKKNFAQRHVIGNGNVPREFQGVMFALYEGKVAFEEVVKFVTSYTNTGTKIEKIRGLFSGLKWDVTAE
jgi:T4 RnlA family RNA ligase